MKWSCRVMKNVVNRVLCMWLKLMVKDDIEDFGCDIMMMNERMVKQENW